MIKKRKRGLIIAGVLVGLLLLLALCVADSKYNFEQTEYKISSAALPEEFSGFRIVQISDLHGSRFGAENRRLVEAVIAQKPDLIALTGDLITTGADLPAAEELLRGIAGVAPTYFVCGNHEWGSGCVGEMTALMERYGVERLSNEYEPLERGGARMIVAGAEDPNGRADMPRPDEFIEGLRREYPEDFVLMLGHRNFWVQQYPELPVELILSGHAHGGIIRLPFVGGLLDVQHRLGAQYEKGLYASGSYVMAVSRGLGNSIIVPRLFNRPEIVTIVLESAA